MRTELYSVRSSEEEISFINRHLKKIVTELNNRAAVKVLFKTEIDWNPKKIKADLFESLVESNPPELLIFINAIDTKDSSSFQTLFGPFMDALEKEILKNAPPEYKKSELYPNINVQTLEGFPGEYPAYCFIYNKHKVLVLPALSLIPGNTLDYLCDAVNAAKDLFFKMYEECPDGYIYTNNKPLTFKDRLMAFLKKNDDSQPKATEDITESEAPAEATEPGTLTEIITPEALSEPTAPIVDTEEPEASDTDTINFQSEPAEDLIIFDEEEPEDRPEPPVDIQDDTEDGTDSDVTSDTENDSDEDNEKTPKFRNFIKSFIPMKGDSVKAILLKIVVLVAIITFLTGAGLLFKFYVIDPAVNQSDMKEIQDIFYSSTVEVVTDPEGNVIATYDEVTRNWEGLEKVNKEIVGWIKIDKTKVDYPILFHKEDNEKSQFYLYKNYKKKYSDFGSIFMDYRCADGIDSKHVILHGHNMGSDDSMFGSLLKYANKDGWTQGNTKFYKSSPIVTIDTPDGSQDWVIFAVMKIDVANNNKAIFNYLQTEFEGSAQYMNFIYNIKARSYLDINVPINEKDRLLTLSTCSYETDNMRTIVVARQLRENEDVSKYTKKVKQATPQGTVYSSFASEYKEGNLSWYDGSGKLKGNGELEFMEQSEMFKVTFVDAKGKKILTQYVLKGEDATAPVGAPPIKESDDTYNYVFRKWSPKFTKVTKDLTIKPVYDKYLKPTPTTNPTDAPEKPQPQATQAPVVPATTQAPVTQATTQVVQNTPVETTPATQATIPPTDPVETVAAE